MHDPGGQLAAAVVPDSIQTNPSRICSNGFSGLGCKRHRSLESIARLSAVGLRSQSEHTSTIGEGSSAATPPRSSDVDDSRSSATKAASVALLEHDRARLTGALHERVLRLTTEPSALAGAYAVVVWYLHLSMRVQLRI
jgi:hypothetical protein